MSDKPKQNFWQEFDDIIANLHKSAEVLRQSAKGLSAAVEQQRQSTSRHLDANKRLKEAQTALLRANQHLERASQIFQLGSKAAAQPETPVPNRTKIVIGENGIADNAKE